MFKQGNSQKTRPKCNVPRSFHWQRPIVLKGALPLAPISAPSPLERWPIMSSLSILSQETANLRPTHRTPTQSTNQAKRRLATVWGTTIKNEPSFPTGIWTLAAPWSVPPLGCVVSGFTPLTYVMPHQLDPSSPIISASLRLCGERPDAAHSRDAPSVGP